jgi:hypothetical protein
MRRIHEEISSIATIGAEFTRQGVFLGTGQAENAGIVTKVLVPK